MSAVDAEETRREAALEVMRGAGAIGPRARVLELSQLEGGWSRHSWAMTVEDPDAGRLDVILRVRPQGATLETDLAQEFRTFELLADEPVPTPPVYGMAYEEDTPFEGPFFAMGRLPGWSPNVWRPKDRKVLEDDWAAGRGYATELVDAMAAIHVIPTERVEGVVEPRDYDQNLDHWHDVWDRMRLVDDPVVEEAYVWARGRKPDQIAPRLVHGDYRIGNCLIEEGHITGVLDWEIAHLGDPRFDLGYMALDYHAGKFAKPGSKLLNAVADRQWFHDRYAEKTGQPVDSDVVDTFSVIGALMLIAILTTGIRVYSERRSEDIRMAWGRFAIPGLRQDIVRLMGW